MANRKRIYGTCTILATKVVGTLHDKRAISMRQQYRFNFFRVDKRIYCSILANSTSIRRTWRQDSISTPGRGSLKTEYYQKWCCIYNHNSSCKGFYILYSFRAFNLHPIVYRMIERKQIPRRLRRGLCSLKLGTFMLEYWVKVSQIWRSDPKRLGIRILLECASTC